VTDDNVVCLAGGGWDAGRDHRSASRTRSWAVGELAVANHLGAAARRAEPGSVTAAVARVPRLRPLSAAEAAALWPLVVLRAAVVVVQRRAQAAIDGVND